MGARGSAQGLFRMRWADSGAETRLAVGNGLLR